MSSCYIIAEVGLSHMGSFPDALFAIQAFSAAGADAIKFQDHRWQVVPDGQPHPSPHVKDMTRKVWYEETAFNDDEWRRIREHCAYCGADYICSPFSVDALRRQVELRPRYIKIASGEVTNLELLRAAKESRVDLLVSSGMCNEAELKAAERLLPRGERTTWMACTSSYPCPPEASKLDWIANDYMSIGGPLAVSDHTAGTWFPIAAAAHGLDILEKHVHLEDCAHSDRDIALTPERFREMVDGIRAVEKALYEPSEPDLTEIRRVYLHATS